MYIDIYIYIHTYVCVYIYIYTAPPGTDMKPSRTLWPRCQEAECSTCTSMRAHAQVNAIPYHTVPYRTLPYANIR